MCACNLALDHALPAQRSVSVGSGRRQQFSSEYTFLELDLIVQREYTEVHTELLTEAERRMEAFHGGA